MAYNAGYSVTKEKDDEQNIIIILIFVMSIFLKRNCIHIIDNKTLILCASVKNRLESYVSYYYVLTLPVMFLKYHLQNHSFIFLFVFTCCIFCAF